MKNDKSTVSSLPIAPEGCEAALREIVKLGENARSLTLSADMRNVASRALFAFSAAPQPPSLGQEEWEGPAYEYGVTWGPDTSPSSGEAEAVARRDELRAVIIAAYVAGARNVHNNWQEDSDPDFIEAAHDYAVAALSPKADGGVG